MLGKRYEIYIGLKDKETYQEIFDEETFAKILSKLCKDKKIGFSLVNQLGGYSHNKGYTTETSLKITLIGSDQETADKLGEVLKEIINTDTILITTEDIEYFYK